MSALGHRTSEANQGAPTPPPARRRRTPLSKGADLPKASGGICDAHSHHSTTPQLSAQCPMTRAQLLAHHGAALIPPQSREYLPSAEIINAH
jgi:hypothetical protein